MDSVAHLSQGSCHRLLGKLQRSLCKFCGKRLSHASSICRLWLELFGPEADTQVFADDQEKADKTKLKFFKISEAGLLDAARDSWAANVLTNNNNSWLVRLPEDIAPGNYVLRHEIIALHVASQPNGAQNYPFCFSLAVSSQGTKNPDGIPATQFYKASDPGVTFDLTRKYDSYKIPGASFAISPFCCRALVCVRHGRQTPNRTMLTGKPQLDAAPLVLRSLASVTDEARTDQSHVVGHPELGEADRCCGPTSSRS